MISCDCKNIATHKIIQNIVIGTYNKQGTLKNQENIKIKTNLKWPFKNKKGPKLENKY